VTAVLILVAVVCLGAYFFAHGNEGLVRVLLMTGSTR